MTNLKNPGSMLKTFIFVTLSAILFLSGFMDATASAKALPMPDEEHERLAQKIDELSQEGQLGHPLAQQLRNSLKQAVKFHEEGKVEKSTEFLQKMLDQMDNKGMQKNITPEAKQILAGEIQALITLWTSPPDCDELEGSDKCEMTNIALHKPYTVSFPASDAYPDVDGKELTDGTYGSTDFMDSAWVGHNANIDREFVIDLQEAKSISSIKMNALNDSGVGISLPEVVKMYVSENGVDWAQLITIPKLPSQGSVFTGSYEWDGKINGLPSHQPQGTMVYARYVKIYAMVDFWLFIDEMEVWGVDGKLKKAVKPIPDPYVAPNYLQAGEKTGNINDLVLFYNGQYSGDVGNWTSSYFEPYVTYMDTNGQPTDWMFDAGLFLGTAANSGRVFSEGANPSNKADWEWYAGKTLTGPNADAAQLNEAVKQAAQAMNDPNHKMKVVIMIPFPASNQTNFGDVDGDGITENLSVQADKQKALNWYIDLVRQKWGTGNFTNLELTGFYWMSETVSDQEAMKYTADLVHSLGYKYYWIPYYEASLYWKWEYLGFDAMAYQPNHYFANTTADRIREAADRAKRVGSGLEIELDDGVFLDGRRQKLIDYLQGAQDYGYDGNTFRAYYQDLHTLYKAATSTKKRDRQVYEWMYSLIKGYPLDFSEPDPDPTVSLNKNEFVPGETITVSYTGTSGKDWIGIYHKDGVPGSGNPSLVWKYASEGGQPNGTLTFDTSTLSQLGFYDVVLLADDGYEELARVTFELTETPAPDFVNLALHKPYTASNPPEPQYSDTDGKELTDGLYGSTSFYDPEWQGHAYNFDRYMTVDLGEPKSIASIAANFLQDSEPGINAPDDIKIAVSMDGQQWARVAAVSKPGSTESGAHTLKYAWDGAIDGLPAHQPQGEMVYARYVRINFVLNVWGFIDEIEVLGIDGRAAGAVELTPEESENTDGAYLKAGEATAGINNLMLFYNGQYSENRGDWKTEQFIPYVAEIDANHQPVDWLFDGGLFLGLNAPSGRSFVETGWSESSKKEDWEWYLNKTFAAQTGDAAQLNEAVKEVGNALNDPNHKMKIVIMIPLPSTTQSDFGDVDGDGVSENFSDPTNGLANKKKAVEWYLNQLTAKWNAANFSNLELAGFYWMHEAAGADDQAVIRYASDRIHNLNYKFFWIPYYNATAYYNWKTFGFDAMAYQPNHFFNNTDPVQIKNAADAAKKVGSGVEIELDDRAFDNGAFRQRYVDYLNGAVDYGYGGDVFRAYYQDIRTLYNAAYSSTAANRDIYDWTVQLLRGTYVKQ